MPLSEQQYQAGRRDAAAAIVAVLEENSANTLAVILSAAYAHVAEALQFAQTERAQRWLSGFCDGLLEVLAGSEEQGTRDLLN